MRLATWNVNGLRARLGYFLLWLEEVRPDVVGLQELKMTDEQFPHEALAGVGYRAVAHGQKSWNGVAIVSREPARVTQVGLPGQEELGARLLGAEIAGLSFTTVYCPNGKDVSHDDFARKLAWFDTLHGHVTERAADRPAVLCGDFNIVPAAIDGWNEQAFRGSIFHTDEERARLERLLEAGYRDAFRAARPDEPGFSWWDYRGNAFHRRRGLRIDLILATPGLVERIQDASVDRRWRKKNAGMTPSDHAPVWIDVAD